jgi:hypothetical protein
MSNLSIFFFYYHFLFCILLSQKAHSSWPAAVRKAIKSGGNVSAKILVFSAMYFLDSLPCVASDMDNYFANKKPQ